MNVENNRQHLEPGMGDGVPSATEQRRLLVGWNNTTVDYPKDQCLHHLFEAQVARTPSAIALVFENSRLTYQQLNTKANQLAGYLQSLEIGPEVLVALCMERSSEMVIAMLAILKAGGAYVPLDPNYPQERIDFMLKDARVRALITQQSLLKRLPGHGVKSLCLDTDWEMLAQGGEENSHREVTSENLAYVIYTSGSTGRPKGVAIEHRSAVTLLHWARTVFMRQDLAGTLASTSTCFDLSVFEIFVPLSWGGKVILAENALQLPDLPTAKEVTLINTVPSAMAALLKVGGVPDSVRTVNLAGEPLKTHLVQEIYQQTKVEKVFDLYGPSEDTTYTTYTLRSGSGPATIGRPIANTQIYLLDEHLQPTPVGIPGELYIGGEGLARGYLHQPEFTAEKFIPNPFSEHSGARLYKTGDLARYFPDGNIEFLGRIDHQVKIRGFRIELGEIEAVLSQHPSVREALVTGQENRSGNTRLVAYLVADGLPAPAINELRSFLASKLPEHMVPAAFVMLETLPLTPNGKVDRRALPAPDQRRPELEQAYTVPRTDLERYLADLWCEILQLEQVGIHDKFFELGGDSIQGALLINRLKQELGEFIYIVALFESPTIADLAAFLNINYAKAVKKLVGADADPRSQLPRGSVDSKPARKVDSAMLAEMRHIIPALPMQTGAHRAKASKNPPAIFILAPPRSGTTLLRIMLAGNPNLFAAAELQLLGFNTLAERRTTFAGKFSLWLEGTLRAIMEIKGCDADEAKRIMKDYEQRGFTTKQFYEVLQDWIQPRILVDKSPSYALDPETLKRAEADFDNALYIHLVRHPYAMVRSFESYHLDQVFFTYKHSFSARELGELVWLTSHQNILEFLKDIPKQRQHRIQFEELVSRPHDVIEEMCETLGLAFHPDMVEPYKDSEKKMLDGIYAASTPMGDTNFLKHQGINPEVAEKSKGFITEDFLGNITWQVAELLGYETAGLLQNSSQEKEPFTSSRDGNDRRSLMQRQQQRRTAYRKNKTTNEG